MTPLIVDTHLFSAIFRGYTATPSWWWAAQGPLCKDEVSKRVDASPYLDHIRSDFLARQLPRKCTNFPIKRKVVFQPRVFQRRPPVRWYVSFRECKFFAGWFGIFCCLLCFREGTLHLGGFSPLKDEGFFSLQREKSNCLASFVPSIGLKDRIFDQELCLNSALQNHWEKTTYS